MIVFGIDPGVRTGLTELRVNTDMLGLPMAEILAAATWRACELSGQENSQVTAIVGAVSRACASGDHVMVSCEDFILTRMRSSSRDLLAPIRITAALRWALRQPVESGRIRWFSYSPADAKGIVTNERLRGWGAWVKGSDHSRDAMRHALMAVRGWRGDG